MPQIIRETAALSAVPVANKPGRLLVTLITPGQGTSGYYAPAVLEAAAVDKVFPAGTQMFLDHPTESEQYERPERSVKDLGAVLAEDARWDGSALVAEADTFSQHRDLLGEMQAHIGVSVRAAAEVSEAQGKGRVIEKLHPASSNSVDFVTRAGRGGSFTVLESVRPGRVNARALKHDGVSEATVNDQREALDRILKELYGGDKTWVWLRDFDASTAWFEIESGEDIGTWSQSYDSVDGLATSLTGERTEVRQVTQYVPVNPAGQPTTQESKEDTMAMKQIEESEFNRLSEADRRVTTLESERDTAIKERDTAKAENVTLKESLAVRDRRDRAAEIVAAEARTAEVELNEFEVAGMVTALPVKEGALDEDAFTETVKKNLTRLAESGRVRGFGGGSTSEGGVSEADFDEAFKAKGA